MSKKLIRPTDTEDVKITAAALADPDNPPLNQEILVEELEKREKQRMEERQKSGRYTLDEAAEIIASNALIRADYVLKKLKESVGECELKVYQPNGLQPYEPKPHPDAVYIPGLSNPIKKQVFSWYVEAFWDDLNNWLEKKEGRIKFRFPNPNQESRPEKRQIQQEKEILRIIKEELRLDPLNLPAIEPGKSGTKATVREKLGIPRSPFQSNIVFDKAWGRLHTKKLIIENGN